MNSEKDTAKQIIELLDESTERMDSSVLSRLADARSNAIAQMQAASIAVAGSASLSHVVNEYLHHHRALMPTAILCGTVIIVFLVTQQFMGAELIEQGDAFLLASDLPPEAYLDRGFDEWLERTSQH